MTACNDIPVKGRGGAGVGFHLRRRRGHAALSDGLPTGFTAAAKKVKLRAGRTIKGAGSDVAPPLPLADHTRASRYRSTDCES